jgi:hypothetical protein
MDKKLMNNLFIPCWSVFSSAIFKNSNECLISKQEYEGQGI